jgi:hypothetical protein
MRNAFDSCQESGQDQQGLLEGRPLLLQAAIVKFSYRHGGCDVNLSRAYSGEYFLLPPLKEDAGWEDYDLSLQLLSPAEF